MKRILLIVLVILLVGCQSRVEPTKVKKVEIEPEQVEEIEEVEYVERDQMKELVLLTNMKTDVVDIALLHERLSEKLLDAVDLDISIDEQSELIEEVIREELTEWKREQVEIVLDENNIELNADDFETLVDRTSYNDAYQLMSVYEKIFLEKQQ